MNEHVIRYYRHRIENVRAQQDRAFDSLKDTSDDSVWFKYLCRRIEHFDRVIKQLIAKRRYEFIKATGG